MTTRRSLSIMKGDAPVLQIDEDRNSTLYVFGAVRGHDRCPDARTSVRHRGRPDGRGKYTARKKPACGLERILGASGDDRDDGRSRSADADALCSKPVGQPFPVLPQPVPPPWFL